MKNTIRENALREGVVKTKPYRAVVNMCFNVETADKARAEKDIEYLVKRSLSAFGMSGSHSPVKLESIERPLPCPFCGKDAKTNLIALNGFTVRCSDGDCIGSTIVGTYNRQGDAIEAWNRRCDD